MDEDPRTFSSVELHEWAQKQTPEVLREWHREGTNYTGTYPEDGQSHLDVLLAEGLKPDSKVLEIGCGSLHGGRKIMEFLNIGNYCGIDPNEWSRVVSLYDPALRDLFQERQPRFASRDDFDGSEFGMPFDFVFSHSVLSHASASQFGQYLRNTKAVLTDGGKIVASLFLADSAKDWSGIGGLGDPGTPDGDDSNDENWVYPGRSYFTWATIQHEAGNAGLTLALRPEHTKTVQEASLLNGWSSPGHCHDWIVLQKIS